jgi:hypothetical protein
MKYQIKSLFIAALSLLSCASQAALIDHGNGLIYDKDQDITWLKDANSGGRLNWTAANAWAEQLTVGGFSDWRLPGLTNSTVFVGANSNNSELAHLFYGQLGGQAEADLADQHNVNYDLFNNLQSSVYWLKDEQAIAPGLALGWGFVIGSGVLSGYQNLYNEDSEFHAWAVHSGDIGASTSVPVPAAAWLFASGLLGVLGIRSKKRSL